MTQDIRLIELFNKYNMKATFNINSDLLGREGHLIREEDAFGDHWGYAVEDLNFKSPALMIEELADCRKYGANMLINVGPMGDGSLRPMDTAILGVMGQWVNYFDGAIRAPRPTGIVIENKPDDFILKDGKNYYLFCFKLPMRGDINVAWYEDTNYTDTFELPEEIASVTWMDNGADVTCV